MNPLKKVSVLGAGPMAMTLARILAKKCSQVNLYVPDNRIAEELNISRKVKILDNNFNLPRNITITSATNFEEDEYLFIAVSSKEFEDTMENILNNHSDKKLNFAIFTKGFPAKSSRKKYGLTFSQYLKNYCQTADVTGMSFAIINGPSLIAELLYDKYSFFNIILT